MMILIFITRSLACKLRNFLVGKIVVGYGDFRFLMVFFYFLVMIFGLTVVILCLSVVIFQVTAGSGCGRKWSSVI